MSWRLTVFAVFSVAICGGLVLVLWSGFGRDPHQVPFELLNKPAPTFQLRPLEGGAPVTLADFKGKVVVLNFWSSWCGPCKIEHPELEWAAQAIGDDAVFLGMVFQDTDENAKEFLARHGGSYPQLVDPQSLVAVDFGVAGVPETYFIDPAGVIRYKHVGPIRREAVVAQVQKLKQVAAGAAP